MNDQLINVALLISYVYNVLYSIWLYLSLHHSDIARPNIYIFLIPFLYFRCVYCYETVRYYLLDITALLELETHIFRYTRNNIC